MKETPETISPILLDIKQVCQLLNISRSKFYELKEAGKIGPPQVGLSRKALYRKDEIERWIQLKFPNKKQWSKIMNKDNKFENKCIINIQNFNGVLENVQSNNIQNGNNLNCINYNDKKQYKKVLTKKNNILKEIFTLLKNVIALFKFIKIFILKILF